MGSEAMRSSPDHGRSREILGVKADSLASGEVFHRLWSGHLFRQQVVLQLSSKLEDGCERTTFLFLHYQTVVFAYDEDEYQIISLYGERSHRMQFKAMKVSHLIEWFVQYWPLVAERAPSVWICFVSIGLETIYPSLCMSCYRETGKALHSVGTCVFSTVHLHKQGRTQRWEPSVWSVLSA